MKQEEFNEVRNALISELAMLRTSLSYFSDEEMFHRAEVVEKQLAELKKLAEVSGLNITDGFGEFLRGQQ